MQSETGKAWTIRVEQQAPVLPMSTAEMRDGNARRKLPRTNECGHPDRKHYAKGMCQPCYQREYKLDEVGHERRAEAQRIYQQSSNGRDAAARVRRGTGRDEDADYAEWTSLGLTNDYQDALTNQGTSTGHWSAAKLDWVCFRMWQREMRQLERKRAQDKALDALRPTEVEIEGWLIEADDR